MRCLVAIKTFQVAVTFTVIGSAHADIVWHRPAEPIRMQTLTGKAINFDMNSDGFFEFVLQSDGATFDTLPLLGTSILSIPDTLPNLGAKIIPLAHGAVIDNTPNSPASWVDPVTTPMFSSCMVQGCIGLWLFPNDIGYFGVQFQIQEATHYGWVYLDNTFSGLGGGDIVEWAYESRPGVAIMAGMVPEPSSTVLLVLGSIMLWNFRKKLLTTGCCGRNTAAEP